MNSKGCVEKPDLRTSNTILICNDQDKKVAYVYPILFPLNVDLAGIFNEFNSVGDFN